MVQAVFIEWHGNWIIAFLENDELNSITPIISNNKKKIKCFREKKKQLDSIERLLLSFYKSMLKFNKYSNNRNRTSSSKLYSIRMYCRISGDSSFLFRKSITP